MSTIRSIDLRFVDELVNFVRGAGYVLDFSDPTFSEFFAAELNIDIDDPRYAEHGGSKGKRLRCLLQVVDDATAVKVLRALWEHRTAFLARTGNIDPVHNAEGQLLTLIQKLQGVGAGALGEPPRPVSNASQLIALRDELNSMHALAPQPRGYAFEAFLKTVFDLAGLEMRSPFRNIGEQIDGSFLLGNEIYLVEAKWQQAPTGIGDLHAFHGKLDKAAWTRGVFISFNGFSPDGLSAFGVAKRMICMDGRDLYQALDRQTPISAVLERKIRRAAETGKPFIPFSELFS
jgi:Restriction endonuclease